VRHEHAVEIGNGPEEQKQQRHQGHRPGVGAGGSGRGSRRRSSNRSSHTGRKVQKKPAPWGRLGLEVFIEYSLMV
jgi:hypothetical protein